MSQTAKQKLPSWLRRPLPAGGNYADTKNRLDSLGLETVCENANCPNKGICWSRHTATIMILGNICTRNCKFCSVPKGKPKPPDATEPNRVAQLAKNLELKYLVITSVNRDDLPDGGAHQFQQCLEQTRNLCPEIKFEILTPDFRHCQDAALDILNNAMPFIFAHNVETVPSLYHIARKGADYQLSLNLLKKAKKYFADVTTKSSIMLGLGETEDQVLSVLKDLRNAGCDRITIGQYLKPSPQSLDVVEYITPEKFQWWEQKAKEIGFRWVISSPYARSSFLADSL